MPATDAETTSRRTHWHQSSLSTILECPRCFLREVLCGDRDSALDTVAGTAHHAGVAAHEVARMNGYPDGITEAHQGDVARLALTDELTGVPEADLAAYAQRRATKAELAKATDLGALGRAILYTEVEACVQHWWHTSTDPATGAPSPRQMLMGLTPLAIEQYGLAPAGTTTIAGTFDGLYADPAGDLILVDQKTSAEMRRWAAGDAGYHRRQATFYSALLLLDPNLQARFGADRLVSMRFVVVRRKPQRRAGAFIGARLLDVAPTLLDLQTLAADLDKARAIRALGAYPRNPAYQFCRCTPDWWGDPDELLAR